MAQIAQIGPDHLRHHPIFNRVLTRRSQPRTLGPWVDLAGHSHPTYPPRLPNSVSRSTNLKGPGRVSRSARHPGLSWLASGLSLHWNELAPPQSRSPSHSSLFPIGHRWNGVQGTAPSPRPHDQAWLAPISISRHASRFTRRIAFTSLCNHLAPPVGERTRVGRVREPGLCQ